MDAYVCCLPAEVEKLSSIVMNFLPPVVPGVLRYGLDGRWKCAGQTLNDVGHLVIVSCQEDSGFFKQLSNRTYPKRNLTQYWSVWYFTVDWKTR